mgnify:CR=1 FL=1
MVPTRNRRLNRKVKAVRGDKVFCGKPGFWIMSHEKENGSFPPGWSCPCRSSRRSRPDRERHFTPSFLKFPQISASTRSSLARAVERSSTVTPKSSALYGQCRYCFLPPDPLTFPHILCGRCCNRSSCMGMLTLYRLSGRLLWFRKESWNGMVLSK